MFAVNKENLKELKCHIFFKKIFFLLFDRKCGHEHETIFWE